MHADYADLKKKSQWPKTTVLFATLPVFHRSQGLFCSLELPRARLMESPPSPTWSVFNGREQENVWMFSALAVKYSGQKTHGTSVYSPLARNQSLGSNVSMAQEVRSFPVTGSKEMEIFGKEHRCSVHTWWFFCLPASALPSLPLKLLRGGTFPGMWETRAENSSLQTRLPSPVTLAWIDSPWTLSQVCGFQEKCVES